jgi:hypothetical protein
MTTVLASSALLVVAGLVAVSGLAASGCASSPDEARTGAGDATLPGATGDAVLAAAFKDRAHDLEVEGQGTVVRILADDTDGGRHQRFIVRLASGQTLLVAHNIDVAPKVGGLREGDTVGFRGVYEWNEEGGTIHWTHHDPEGEHAPGWIRHDGRTYQ